MMKTKTEATDRGRIPELDGFRVLLVGIVAWFHIWQQSWWTPGIGSVSLDFLVRAGYMMVDGTILLSAFLLFLPWARTMLHGEPIPDTKRFYRRRAMRILPNYYVDQLILLLAVAVPLGQYASWQFLVKDLVTHATFTFTFWQDTYLASPIGGACWTVAIEMQAYLLFPWIARLVMKHPAVTLTGMVAVAFAFRGWCLATYTDYQLVVNQLPSFLDVYALGIALSLLYIRLKDLRLSRCGAVCLQAVATLAVAGGLWGTLALLQRQAMSQGFNGLQGGQMLRRFPLALALGCVLIGLPFAVKPVRWLFGNRVTRALAALSMNFYLLHQPIAVQMKRLHIPVSVSDTPNMASEMPWQMQYTWLWLAISLAVAAILTWGVEKPAARCLVRWFARRDERSFARRDAAFASLCEALNGAELRLTAGEVDITSKVHAVTVDPSCTARLTLAEGQLCLDARQLPRWEMKGTLLPDAVVRLNGQKIYACGAMTDRRWMRLNSVRLSPERRRMLS